MIIVQIHFKDISWEKYFTDTAPENSLHHNCCFLIKVLLLGSFYEESKHTFTIYDIQSKSWEYTGLNSLSYSNPILVTLGSRVLVLINQDNSAVQEFFYYTHSFRILPPLTKNSGYGGSVAVSVPAKLFSQLPGGCRGVL